ncbi:MAG: tRNA (adenosine(37)-N6)-threonylcarbamoyltransferase complex ATPase subunit type 1 TsaE [Gammaproteobacteria bacterium RIFCSPLOWO2_02_FULL_42_14]|nr:MAG: tRNA (adenosine(37)-N6)-threonylcarbamoyltransferase complex ATPase subunit type 1 TsaE [Gammaproteobacteria bacterium RIFCSPHIGHO2_02_FULL_42_43]OGT27582.1 MAG: tRNA (adenosine(37)-N6)-threonylcarbamoyltransferase complex ATPase subunit type 1 TsaE [Gammaproteobacteria bacterium RIFCSPHIGHO2_01_FULL_42_8]OGT53064.1 MAG: tRNA (adenosine(37)-N6)-threonylcarbamoyltransferase complex ATPase subunit type 1 TsaE [Gammaproteobacteria bacterium RIFCSPHIGHO2_12_FULL_41_25]OGT61324.1 MAG: tRNA (a
MSSTLLKSAADTEQFAEQFSNTLKPPALIFLEGELGAGKTTFMKGLLRGLGFQGTVKSPTFTLVETYDIGARRVVHADFYRLQDANELELIGFRDYLTEESIVVIEWASKAKIYLPEPNWVCTLKLDVSSDRRILDMT